MAFKQLPAFARSQDAYERFTAATNMPLTILAVLWLPVLVSLSATVASYFVEERPARTWPT